MATYRVLIEIPEMPGCLARRDSRLVEANNRLEACAGVRDELPAHERDRAILRAVLVL